MARDNGLIPAESARHPWVGYLMVGLLATAALATAWSGYQSSLWSGIQSSSYTQAGAARTNSAQELTAANQFRLGDLSLFEAWVTATIDGNDEVAVFYSSRFRDEFRVAFDAWLAESPFDNPAAPSNPMAMPEYELETESNARELTLRADQLFRDGEEANSNSDTYTLTTLIFAVVLFFTAIAERFDRAFARVVLIGIAAAGLVVGLSVTLTLPITFA